MRDDRGPWLAVGASLFAAANLYKFDRERLERNLRWLAEHGVDYIRALGCVGALPYWEGRQVDPRWSDYPQIIDGTTAFALTCGIRIQWTFFGDAQVMAPSQSDRERVVDVIAAACNAHRTAVIAAEGANESWQNGFGGGAGIEQLRNLVRRFADKCDVPVATSCPVGANEAEQHASAKALYEGSAATYTTNHYDRYMGEEGWRPVRQPWQQLSYDGVPDASLNNEPIGIETGGRNPTDDNPHRQVSQAIVSWISGHWGYTLHDTVAGVRCDTDWQDVTNIETITAWLQASRDMLPSDMPNWSPQNDHWAGHPWVKMEKWVDGAAGGVTRAYAVTNGGSSVCLPMGIRAGVTMTAKGGINASVNKLDGGGVKEASLSGGQSIRLTDEQPVYLVRGEAR